MQSESARAARAAEARFRIDAPNSRPRAIKVIALDRPAKAMVKRLAQGAWNGATFFTTQPRAPPRGQRFSMQGWLGDLAGRTKDLVDEINGADLVVMLATAGEDARAASLIGEACSVNRVTTTALSCTAPSVSDSKRCRAALRNFGPGR